MAQKVMEYICIRCWHSFGQDEATIRAAGGRIICPECGSDQPDLDDVLAAPEDLPPLGGAGRPSLDRKQPDDLDETAWAADLPPLIADVGTAGEGPEDPDDEGAVFWAPHGPDAQGPALDPMVVTWRLRSAIGIVYNFPGIQAVLRWSAGKKDLVGMAISIEGFTEWKDFEDFIHRLTDTADAFDAFHTARRHGEAAKAQPERPEPLPAIEVTAPARDRRPSEATAETGATESESGAAGETAGQRREARARGEGAHGRTFRTQAAGEFKFRVHEQPQRKPSRVFSFIVGFLLGAGAVLALWLFNVLDRLRAL